jgi:hypothetical protein
VLTDRAHEVLADHEQQRNRHYARMLSAWSEQDLKRFATLLHRFTDDFDKFKTDWLPARSAGSTSSATPAEGND